jgi:hypothetical protein
LPTTTPGNPPPTPPAHKVRSSHIVLFRHWRARSPRSRMNHKLAVRGVNIPTKVEQPPLIFVSEAMVVIVAFTDPTQIKRKKARDQCGQLRKCQPFEAVRIRGRSFSMPGDTAVALPKTLDFLRRSVSFVCTRLAGIRLRAAAPEARYDSCGRSAASAVLRLNCESSQRRYHRLQHTSDFAWILDAVASGARPWSAN